MSVRDFLRPGTGKRGFGFVEEQAQNKIVGRCLQLFGGCGYMTSIRLRAYGPRCPGAAVYAGTSEIMTVLIARSL